MPTVLDSHLRNRFQVQPNHSNFHENVHGGNVMKWLDEVGAMSAMRFAGQPCVTARMGAINFRRSVPVGDTVLIEAYVYDAGSTSIHVSLTVSHEDPLTGQAEPVTETTAVYVAVDEDGEPVSVPDLTVKTDEGQQLRTQVHASH